MRALLDTYYLSEPLLLKSIPLSLSYPSSVSQVNTISAETYAKNSKKMKN